MAKTATELAAQVLRELVKLDAIEVAAAEDDEYVQDLSATYHPTLTALDVNVHWDYASIPEKVFFPLAGVLADVAARSYGVNVSPDERELRLRVLKKAAAFKYLGPPTVAEYF